HQRMADESRRAAALRERAQNLLLLDELLPALRDVLDIRDIFDHVSTIAQKVMRHDAMSIVTLTEGADTGRVHALTDFEGDVRGAYETPFAATIRTEPWEFRMIDDLGTNPRYAASPAVRSGMQSALLVPVRIEDRLNHIAVFYSKSRNHFTRDDVLIGRRIADHLTLALSHHHLAEESRSNAELKARVANLEMLDDLLAAVTDTGQLLELFDRVSAIAQKVLPHDAASMPVVLPDGRHARR